MYYLARLSSSAAEILDPEPGFISPLAKLKYWCRRRSVTITRTIRPLGEYALAHQEDLLPFRSTLARRGHNLWLVRLGDMVASVSDDEAEELRSRCFDVDRTRSARVGESASLTVAGSEVRGTVVREGGRVTIEVSGMRVSASGVYFRK